MNGEIENLNIGVIFSNNHFFFMLLTRLNMPLTAPISLYYSCMKDSTNLGPQIFHPFAPFLHILLGAHNKKSIAKTAHTRAGNVTRSQTKK